MLRSSMTAVVVALVMPLAAAMADESTAGESHVRSFGSRTECRADQGRGDPRLYEPDCLAATNGLAARAENQLVIRASDGSRLGFSDDRDACDRDDAETCKIVHIDSFDPVRGFVVIATGSYDETEFSYLDLTRKVIFDLAAVPIFSPRGDRFVVVDQGAMSEPDADFLIYEIDGSGLHRRLQFHAARSPDVRGRWSFGRWDDDDHLTMLVEGGEPQAQRKEVRFERGRTGNWSAEERRR